MFEVSSADLSSMKNVRQALQERLVREHLGFRMPDIYTAALDYVRESRKGAESHDASARRMLGIKCLLQELGLVYPADNKLMTATSSLIVPAYWQMRSQDDQDEARLKLSEWAGDALSAGVHCYEWRYEFTVKAFPIMFFQQVMMRLLHIDLQRVTTTASVVMGVVPGESALRLELIRSKCGNLIRVEAAAVTGDLARAVVRFACMAVEKGLALYPGMCPFRLAGAAEEADLREVNLDADTDSDDATRLVSDLVPLTAAHDGTLTCKLAGDTKHEIARLSWHVEQGGRDADVA
ncbi:hypothetical protein P43SY_009943 [Pythium insidiosum]|uniref:Uncharacterized protein n=1 Tax=Pythium insidiosum TaxID=114742 RepID=A0AAD5Q9H4_PYTIN|nr:hypothetical protein P43SY_009943 [Pythium insidiosum]